MRWTKIRKSQNCEMAREIAKSRTGHALPPLRAIIRSLNKAMLLKQRIQDHEQRLARLELAKSMMRISEKTLSIVINDTPE